MDGSHEATAGAAAGLLPPIEGDPAGAGGNGPWQPSILRAVVQHGGCLRCALRMAGVRRPGAFQAPLPALQAALAAVGVGGDHAAPSPPTADRCCPICLGILQEESGVGAAAVAEVEAAVKGRGYELGVDGGERRLAFALGLSLPYCEAIRSRACWEWLAASSSFSSTGGLAPSQQLPLEVKEIVRAAVEEDVARRLGLRPDANAGELRVSLTLLHPAADQADYAGAVKALLPAAQGRAFNRTKKRKRSHGSNSDNLCSQTVVTQLLDAARKHPSVRDGLVGWFKGLLAAATGGGDGDGGQRARLAVRVAREPLFLYGRYQKFSREMPQTAWVVEGGQRMGKASVEEVVAEPIKEWCGAKETVFMGSGREDIDVRMLGSGRPFLLQVNDPRRVPQTQAEVTALEAAVNATTGLNAVGDVKVTCLRLSDRGMVKRMHEGAEAKQKLYTCLVWARRALTPEELREKLEARTELEVSQKTPVRVLHRRSLMTRPKVIHALRCEGLRHEAGGPGGGREAVSYFTLHLRTSAGTYVKEFVHGDLGRTSPSVGALLGCEADILELDVTDVLLADPDPEPASEG